MLPREFPQGGFPPEYALKDIDYVMELAAQTNTWAAITGLARRCYESAASNASADATF